MNYKDYLTNLISGLGIEKELIEISVPPKEGMGDYCLPCFKIKVDNLNNFIQRNEITCQGKPR